MRFSIGQTKKNIFLHTLFFFTAFSKEFDELKQATNISTCKWYQGNTSSKF